MTAQEKIDQLNKELNELKAIQANCTHDWDTRQVNDIKENRSREINKQWHGTGDDMIVTSDTEWYTIYVKGWRRTCTKCGKMQETTKEVPATYKPKFE